MVSISGARYVPPRVFCLKRKGVDEVGILRQGSGGFKMWGDEGRRG